MLRHDCLFAIVINCECGVFLHARFISGSSLLRHWEKKQCMLCVLICVLCVWQVAAALAAAEDVVVNKDLPQMIKDDPFLQLLGGEVGISPLLAPA